MKRLIAVFCLILGFLALNEAKAGELFLRKNVHVKSNPVNWEQIRALQKDAIKNPVSFFRPQEKVVAIFCFSPVAGNAKVEIEWARISPDGRSLVVEKKWGFAHSIDKSEIGKGEYVVYGSVDIEGNILSDGIMGNKYQGNWLAIAKIDGREIARKEFEINHK